MWSKAFVLCAVLSATSARASLIVNGGFETGDFTGWISSGSVGVSCTLDHTGSCAAQLLNGSITQNVATSAGDSYTLDFWYGDLPAELTVFWNGSQIFDAGSGSQPPYIHETFSGLTATGSSTALEFDATGSFGFLILDDVDLVADTGVPEPSSWTSLAGAAFLYLAWRRQARLSGR